MIDEQTLERGLALSVDRLELPELGELQRGKVRDSYVAGDRRFIVVTDRVSAFDVVLGTIPFKGQILNGMASFWFDRTRAVAPNHLISSPDPAVSVVEQCTPFPLEVVVRAYLTGSSPTSLWTHYAAGAREYCGHRLAEGMRQHERLLQPLITPTTKAGAGGHDEPISAAQVVQRGLCTADELEQISDLSLELFALGTAVAAERGLILVDTKYELGRARDGRIIFIDEIHTPDSSRYWHADSYEEAMRRGKDPRPLDKELFRRRLLELGYAGRGDPPEIPDELRLETARRYVEIYEQVTGRPFAPDLEPAAARIRRNLGLPAPTESR